MCDNIKLYLEDCAFYYVCIKTEAISEICIDANKSEVENVVLSLCERQFLMYDLFYLLYFYK